MKDELKQINNQLSELFEELESNKSISSLVGFLEYFINEKRSDWKSKEDQDFYNRTFNHKHLDIEISTLTNGWYVRYGKTKIYLNQEEKQLLFKALTNL